MRKAGEAPKAKAPTVTLANTKPKKAAPVAVTPRPHTTTAMQFKGPDSIPELIQWLGNDFYALTDGDTIFVPTGERNERIMAKKNPDDAALSHLILVINDSIKSTLFVVSDGYWIISDNLDGYTVCTDEDFKKRYDCDK